MALYAGSGALADASAAEQRPVLVGPRVKSIEPEIKGGVDHRDRFPFFNAIAAESDSDLRDDPKASTKSTEHVLLERWLELHAAVRGWSVRAEPFEDRTLAQLFPNTAFYRLRARAGGLEAGRYGCVSLDVPLVLPEDINLLLVLENRRLNPQNSIQLTEVLVRMVDIEGASTMSVASRAIKRDRRTGEMAEVVLESWSYHQGLRKRWTFKLAVPYFHSLAEKVIAIRPRILDGLRPERGQLLDEQDFRGADSGDETYITLWRNPEDRNAMRAVRAAWLDRRRERAENTEKDQLE